ncbi:MAG: LPS export ABC transporter periplasmic protein LptC [Gallionella sp.]|nr:LPS export ABC transporter periplasmic protein LptC [Gallionella sp.]MDD4947473.1 LPS export ABC transporter periplasmic protein LptC [Gallionella sp.]MDD5611524.1 LPS export ABC transporter periplasmic protein LptC [Gallionella sp.]
MIRRTHFRYWLPLIPLLALLAFVYWLDMQVRRDAAAADYQRHDPDVIVENFHATTMDQDGVPRYFMAAHQLRHYPDHDSTEVDLPVLTMRKAAAPDVLMSAQRGEISSKGDTVLLRDDVRVERKAAINLAATSLHTQYLRVLPEQNQADTDKPVTIFSNSDTVHAVGLQMDNHMQTLKLLSQVRSEHLIHAKK